MKRAVCFKVFATGMVATAIGTLMVTKPVKASAYLSGYSYTKAATKKVTVTKKVKVERVKTGKSESMNRSYNAGYLKKGTVVYVSRYMMSTGGIVVKSSKFRPTSRTFYLVPETNSSWYKLAKKTKVKKTSGKKSKGKKSAKKPVKKANKKSPSKIATSKKTVKKTAKKVVKKSAKKTVSKKATPKKSSPKPVVKKQTMAEKYTPVVNSQVINVNQGDSIWKISTTKLIKNWNSLPKGTKYIFTSNVDTGRVGQQTSSIKIEYPDNSSETVGNIKFNVVEIKKDHPSIDSDTKEKAKAEVEQKAKEEAEQKAKAEAEQKAKAEAEQKAKEEAEQKAKAEAEQKAKEEAEQKAKAEAEQKAKEEAEQKAKLEQERENARYASSLACFDGKIQWSGYLDDPTKEANVPTDGSQDGDIYFGPNTIWEFNGSENKWVLELTSGFYQNIQGAINQDKTNLENINKLYDSKNESASSNFELSSIKQRIDDIKTDLDAAETNYQQYEAYAWKKLDDAKDKMSKVRQDLVAIN